jgi:hypothetical protein
MKLSGEGIQYTLPLCLAAFSRELFRVNCISAARDIATMAVEDMIPTSGSLAPFPACTSVRNLHSKKDKP